MNGADAGDMTHAEAWPELAGAALDALPDEERARVLAHAAGCPECGPELRSLAGAASALAALGDTATPATNERFAPDRAAAIRARLLARVAADAGARRGGGSVPPSSPAAPSVSPTLRVERGAPAPARRFGPTSWMAIAAGIAFVAAAIGLTRVAGERDALRDRVGALTAAGATAERERTRLAAELADRDRLVAALTGPAVRVVELTSSGTRAPTARMFWDQAAGAWTLVAHDLPAPGAGRTYQLWLVTRSARISAGTFAPNAAGSAVVRATYALSPADLQAIAVTNEPEGGVPQPTGAMVVVGRAD